MYPVLELFGRRVGSYGLCMAAAVILVGALSAVRAKRYALVFEDVLITGAMALLMGLPTGSLLYILVTYPMEEILRCLASGDLSLFTGGGIVFYGGLIGGIFGAVLGCRIAGCDFAGLERTVVPLLPLGHAIGRIGCLMAGCCYGFAYDGPGCVRYLHSTAGLSPEQGYFPVQLLEGAVNIGLCLFLLKKEKRCSRPMQVVMWYLGSYGVVRFCLEFLRGDSTRGIWLGLSLSQWISLALLSLCGIYTVIFNQKSTPKSQH